MKTCCGIVALLALSGTAALTMNASALADDTPLQMGRIAMPAPSDTGFSGRSIVVVWGTNASDFRAWGTTTQAARAANDINFAGGPAASVNGNVHLVGSYFGIVTPAGATLTTCDIRVSVYSTFTGWIDGTFPGQNLTGQGTLVGMVGTPGFVNFYDPTTNVAMVLGDVPNTAGTDGLFMVEVLAPGTTTLHPTTYIPASIGTALVTGSSDPVRWGDVTGPGGVGPADGLCQPYTATGAALECNLPTVVGGRAFYGGLRGDVPPSPPVAEDVGCLVDGTTTRSTTVAPGTMKWYRICLNTAIDDNTLRYLDIDTEESSGTVELSLYDAMGTVLGYANNNDGSGNHGQLSFGVGRRAAVGDGSQYDGRMGDLDNSFGNLYYVRADNSSGSSPAPLTINFRTNLNTGANGPSTSPILNGVQYANLTPGVNTGSSQLLTALSVDSVRWSQFTLTNCVSSAGGYVDLDFSNLSDGIADVVA